LVTIFLAPGGGNAYKLLCLEAITTNSLSTLRFFRMLTIRLRAIFLEIIATTVKMINSKSSRRLLF
jgi:hypothetical protein